MKNIIKQGRFRKNRYVEELRRKRNIIRKIRGTNKRGIRKKRRNETKKTKGGEVKKGKENISVTRGRTDSCYCSIVCTL